MNYFDHNATTPLHSIARQAWLEATEKFVGNPSSPHRVGARADAALNAARAQLAQILGCDAMDIVWTSGATEANNLVLHHFARTLSARSEMWISAMEHPCVIETARYYFPKRLQLIPVTRAGVVDFAWLQKNLVQKRPGALAVMAANNETGVLQPWREVLALCRELAVPFFCDATQWLGKLPAAGLGEMDFVSGSAHKFGGPRGVGFLKCPARGRVYPLLHGGAQEEGRRAGTENVPGVLAMLAALAHSEERMQDIGLEIQSARAAFEEKLLMSLPGAEIVGADSPRLWNTVSALMPVTDCRQRWVVKLDKAGFAVSTGSACASGKEAPSHVLTAMSYAANDAARVLRFSSGWETTAADWSALLQAILKVHQEFAAPIS